MGTERGDTFSCRDPRPKLLPSINGMPVSGQGRRPVAARTRARSGCQTRAQQPDREGEGTHHHAVSDEQLVEGVMWSG
jgi:hypothetical protein